MTVERRKLGQLTVKRIGLNVVKLRILTLTLIDWLDMVLL